MPKSEARLPLAPLVCTDGEKHAEYKRRRDESIYMKVLPGGESPYLADGWKTSKKLKRFVRLSKAKSLDRQFEDRVWRFFYKMGYQDLNKGHDFTIRYKAADGTFREKQIDIFAKDSETVIVGECKCCDEYKSRPLSKDIAEFVGLRKQFADAIRAHYGRNFKPKILWFFFTDKVLWSQADRNKAVAEKLKIMTEREIDYFSQLSEHLGRATRYQFLAEYLGGQKIAVMNAWGFAYKSNVVWHKVRKDGGSDGRGVGFYFRNVTEIMLFGVRGKGARTLAPGRRQVNLIATRKREHSRKPDEQYEIIEACSPGPFLELFARGTRKGWTTWGNQADDSYRPTWKTYSHHSRAILVAAE
jgi:MT-A70